MRVADWYGQPVGAKWRQGWARLWADDEVAREPARGEGGIEAVEQLWNVDGQRRPTVLVRAHTLGHTGTIRSVYRLTKFPL